MDGEEEVLAVVDMGDSYTEGSMQMKFRVLSTSCVVMYLPILLVLALACAISNFRGLRDMSTMAMRAIWQGIFTNRLRLWLPQNRVTER